METKTDIKPQLLYVGTYADAKVVIQDGRFPTCDNHCIMTFFASDLIQAKRMARRLKLKNFALVSDNIYLKGTDY